MNQFLILIVSCVIINLSIHASEIDPEQDHYYYTEIITDDDVEIVGGRQESVTDPGVIAGLNLDYHDSTAEQIKSEIITGLGQDAQQARFDITEESCSAHIARKLLTLPNHQMIKIVAQVLYDNYETLSKSGQLLRWLDQQESCLSHISSPLAWKNSKKIWQKLIQLDGPMADLTVDSVAWLRRMIDMKIIITINQNNVNNYILSLIGSDIIKVDLSGKNLTQVPFYLNQLINLKFLYLSRNQLTQLPEEIFHGLINLCSLDLNHNQLMQLPNGIFHGLIKLQGLLLMYNELTNFPDSILTLTKLRRLHLAYCFSHELLQSERSFRPLKRKIIIAFANQDAPITRVVVAWALIRYVRTDRIGVMSQLEPELMTLLSIEEQALVMSLSIEGQMPIAMVPRRDIEEIIRVSNSRRRIEEERRRNSIIYSCVIMHVCLGIAGFVWFIMVAVLESRDN